MDVTLTAALITGLCTILAPIITLFLKNEIETKRYQTISKNRRNALKGIWKGYVYQRSPVPDDSIDYEVTITFKPGRKIEKGRAIYKIGDFITDIKLTGGFYDSKYLRIHYENKNPAIIQYGMALFEFASDTKEIRGDFLGYGIRTEGRISGELILEKQ